MPKSKIFARLNVAERRKITKDFSDNETNSEIESVELSQRASITSLQDLKPLVLDSLNTKEKEDVSKVNLGPNHLLH